MYRNHWLHWSFCGAVLLLSPVALSAAPITFGFTGSVVSVPPELASEFTFGESLVGSYTFESTTPDSKPFSPSQGKYENAITSFSATFGNDFVVTQGSGLGNRGITVSIGAISSYTAVDIAMGPAVAGFQPAVFSIFILDLDSSPFTSDDLPLTPVDISEFDVNFSNLTFGLDGGRPLAVLGFQLSSLTLIPEPTTLTLASLSLLAVAYRRRSRRCC